MQENKGEQHAKVSPTRLQHGQDVLEGRPRRRILLPARAQQPRQRWRRVQRHRQPAVPIAQQRF